MTNLSLVPFREFERLKDLDITPETHTELFATYCRINTLYMIKQAGSGHIGSSFSSLDIVCWLFLNELRVRKTNSNQPRDIYFSSKGHDVPGFYSVLIGHGLLEFERIHSLRRLDGLPGHPDISIPLLETNTGSLGMGVSKAKGMISANRLMGREGNVYILTGDGELQEGQFWESLQPAANLGFHEMTVIVDHNKIQSDTWVSQVSDLGDLERKFAAYGWYVERCDGNDVKALGNAIAKLKAVTNQPKILIADTIKGKGISFMEHTAIRPEDNLYHFHSGAPDDEAYTTGVAELIAAANTQLEQVGASPLALEMLSYAKPAVADGAQRLVSAYSKALVTQAERNQDLVVLDADLMLDCGLIPFKDKFPKRFFECGIAEQDMVSQAGGMALKGLLPIVHSFACFLSTRPNEQIYNNATERTKIIYVGSLAGLLPGGPGHSHQSVRDISALGAIPNMVMIEPANEAEVSLALDYCLHRTISSCYIRLVSIPCQIPYQLPEDYQLELGQGIALTEGQDAILFGYGPVLLPQAYQAAQLLAQNHGITLKVVNLPWLNFVDLDWLEQILQGYSWVFTLDNHYVIGGQGDRIVSGLAELGLSGQIQVRQFGVFDIPKCGQNQEVLRAHGLDAESLAFEINKTMM
ncbi:MULTISPECIES: transketolase C-terminal domain-containing protein [Moorena]|uniref:Transketolase n=1 Tax=Moorena producens 3L TaxID=489825 RepID=F4XPA7_9CYAN|nr:MULTISPECIES: transketolase C-terminal domain-containing protein [Moorena]NEQ13023.1 transketolase [Moorena sp. SIO3E2]EGJ33642.1 transketolase [Moorena producens 3L]NEP69658.1 transketolase [Moorena sp. SIO3A5]NEQ09566.1 transketolase [Moorena sp. SIO4E2]NES45873.1 transketolase [Moorena sp. SIO2C4]